MSNLPHSSWAEVYDFAYHCSFGDFYDRLTDATVELISSKIQPPAKIVDFGAGTGRLAIPLAQRGYDVTAVEPCPEMLNQLKKKDSHNSINAICSRMEDFKPEESFDVALCVFTVILYLLDEESLKRSLAAASRVLRHGGVLIIDIPSEAIFRGYSRRDDSFKRSVTVTRHIANIFIYREELVVIHGNGKTAHYEDEFQIRYWLLEQVMESLQSVGFVLTEDLSACFSSTGSRYYIVRKAKQADTANHATCVA